MGMAASQARFLQLTARLSNDEYEAQQINQARSMLADKTAAAAAEYQEAISNRRLLFDPLRQVYNDKNNYQVFTYDSIVDDVKNGGLGMRLVDKSGRVIVPHLPEGITEGSVESLNYIVDEQVLDAKYLEYNMREKGWNLQKPVPRKVNDWVEFDWMSVFEEDISDSDLKNWDVSKWGEKAENLFNYDNLVNSQDNFGYSLRITDGDGKIIVKELPTNVEPNSFEADKYRVFGNDADLSADFVSEMILSGEWKFEELGSTYAYSWSNTDWRSEAGIFDVYDTSDDGAAEAKYTKLTAQYQAQDKELEMRLKQLESEHSALQTEYDAVKKVIDKNIEKTFSTFG